MNRYRHLIRTVTLEVNAGPADAFRFRNEVESWARNALLPGLEAAFAALPEIGPHVRVDRLELALEAADLDHWEEGVLPHLRAGLAGALDRALREAETGAGGESLRPGEDFARKLAFYLEHGVLPWNLTAASPAALRDQAESWLEMEAGSGAARDLAVTWKIPSARRRFLDAFPADLAVRILVRFYGLDREAAREWSGDAARLEAALSGSGAAASGGPADPSASVPASGRPLPRSFLEETLAALAHNSAILRHGLADDIVVSWIGALPAKPGAESMASGASGAGPVRPFPPFRSEAFLRAAARLSRPARDGIGWGNIRDTRGSAPDFPERAAGPGPTASDRASEDRGKARNRSGRSAGGPAAEGIHIPNAGAVLLAPFLAMLFERAGLASGREMRDSGGAIALAHFLATGEEGPAEFQVPLAKVLCGVPLEQAVELPSVLPAAWKDEADSLLRSAIGHWSALKDTSIGGLREGFLQRPGKLTLRPADWLLQVEQRAYDMLLQQLPWSYGFVKLPWMERVLRTEWVD